MQEMKYQDLETRAAPIPISSVTNEERCLLFSFRSFKAKIKRDATFRWAPSSQDITGMRSGRLEAVLPAFQKGYVMFWWCLCECGAIKAVRDYLIVRNCTRSCGCLVSDTTARRNLRHGLHGCIEYGVWRNMIARCESPWASSYVNYGARGIRVCDRWRQSFVDFLADIGRRPSLEYSIERLDPDGNYEPSNCTWVLRSKQNGNRRDTLWTVYQGEKINATEYASRVGISRRAAGRLIKKWQTYVPLGVQVVSETANIVAPEEVE